MFRTSRLGAPAGVLYDCAKRHYGRVGANRALLRCLGPTNFAAGLDAELWPQALASIMRCVGGIAATLEFYNRTPFALKEFHGHAVAPASEMKYIKDFLAVNPRIPAMMAQHHDTILHDYMVLEERQIDRDPFYADFLSPIECRYFISGRLKPQGDEHVGFSVQRSAKQGHVQKSQIELMRRFLPHMQQAVDVARRLKGFAGERQSLEAALDWLADGVVLLRADGSVVYANEAIQAILRSGDGIRTHRGFIEFDATGVQSRFAKSLDIVRRLRTSNTQDAIPDFAAPRPSGSAPYVVSVRPLPVREITRSASAAEIMVLVRDPLTTSTAVIRVLREVFGLTAAEAHVAHALQQGILLDDYARENSVSINTVYTHLRRIKEKTGCGRMPELIRKLNEVQVPLRVL